MVVSAFQNIAAHLLKEDVQIECDVLVAGNKKAARQRVIEMIESAGMVGWHAGPIDNAAAASPDLNIDSNQSKRHRLAFRHQNYWTRALNPRR